MVKEGLLEGLIFKRDLKAESSDLSRVCFNPGLKLCTAGLGRRHVGLFGAYSRDEALLGNNDGGTMLSKSRIQATRDQRATPRAELVAERALDWRKTAWVLVTHWPQTCWDRCYVP